MAKITKHEVLMIAVRNAIKNDDVELFNHILTKDYDLSLNNNWTIKKAIASNANKIIDIILKSNIDLKQDNHIIMGLAIRNKNKTLIDKLLSTVYSDIDDDEKTYFSILAQSYGIDLAF